LAENESGTFNPGPVTLLCLSETRIAYCWLL